MPRLSVVMKRKRTYLCVLALALLLAMLAACSGSAGEPGEYHLEDSLPQLEAAQLAPGVQLKVVATTSIVFDIALQVGGDHIDLSLLIPKGTDPHAFEPSPKDVVLMAQADLVLINGAGLERSLEQYLELDDVMDHVVPVSTGIDLISLDVGEADEHQDSDDHGDLDKDPHTWMDPNNVIQWVGNMVQAFSLRDPEHSGDYQHNGSAAIEKLQELDQWIEEQVSNITEDRRKMITDHRMFSYLTQRYGLEQSGSLSPGLTTLAQPSAKDRAQVQQVVETEGVPVIFVGNTINPRTAEQLASDLGIKVVTLYTGSLSDGEPAGTYQDYMRYNVSSIVSALSEE